MAMLWAIVEDDMDTIIKELDMTINLRKALRDSAEHYDEGVVDIVKYKEGVRFLLQDKLVYVVKEFEEVHKRHFIMHFDFDREIEADDYKSKGMHTVENLPKYFWHKEICNFSASRYRLGKDSYVTRLLDVNKLMNCDNVAYVLNKNKKRELYFGICDEHNKKIIVNKLYKQDRFDLDIRLDDEETNYFGF